MMKNADGKWLSKHKWKWNKKRLVEMLEQNREMYLFGMSDNMYDLLVLFDKAYYLKVDRKLLTDRLKYREKEDEFGKTEEQREMIFGWIDYCEEQAKEEGLEFVDASLTPKQIFDIIASK